MVTKTYLNKHRIFYTPNIGKIDSRISSVSLQLNKESLYTHDRAWGAML